MLHRHAPRIGLALVLVAAAPCTAAPAARPTATDPATAVDQLLLQEQFVQAFDAGVTGLEATAARDGLDGDESLTLLAKLAEVARYGGDPILAYRIASAGVELASHRASVPATVAADLLLQRGLGGQSVRDRALGSADFAEGLRRLDEAGIDALDLRADLVQAQANWLRRVDLEAAARRYEDVLALRRQIPQPDFGTADTLVWLAHAYDGLHRPMDTERTLREARALLVQLGLSEHSLNASLFGVLATVALAKGDLDEALRLRRESARLHGRARELLFPGYARMRYPIGLERLEVVATLAKGDTSSAWAPYVRAHRQNWCDHRARWEARRSNLSSEQELERRESAQRGSEAMFRSLYDPLRTPAGELDASTGPLLLRWLRDRTEVLESWQTLLAEVDLPDDDVLDLHDFQSTLAPDEAFLGLFECRLLPDVNDTAEANSRTGVYGVLVRSTGNAVWRTLDEVGPSQPTSVDLSTQVWRIVSRASGWPLRVGEDRELEDLLGQLYERWIQPFEPGLQGAEHLVLCAPSVAAFVPFAALRSPEGTALADRFSLRCVTSPQMQARLATMPPPKHDPEGAALVLGDPAYAAAQLALPVDDDPQVLWTEGAAGTSLVPRSVLDGYDRGDLSVLDRLPRLPFSRLEATSVASTLPHAELLLGPRATEDALRERARSGQLVRYDTIHVASHALFDRRLFERSALALARVDAEGAPLPTSLTTGEDGLVDITEVASNWQLDADLVTLSGCQTSTTVGQRSQQYPGFVATLLDVGARSVLTSQWKVDDAATALLMRRFYQNRAAGRSKAEALREAQMWLRDHTTATGYRPFQHPVYWAAFFLAGAGG